MLQPRPDRGAHVDRRSFEAHRRAGSERRHAGHNTARNWLQVEPALVVVKRADVLVSRRRRRPVSEKPQGKSRNRKPDGRRDGLHPQRTTQQLVEKALVHESLESRNDDSGPSASHHGQHADLRRAMSEQAQRPRPLGSGAHRAVPHPRDQDCSGTSPAATASSLSDAINAARRRGGIPLTTRAISRRRTAVTAAIKPSPLLVMLIVTWRRLAGSTRRVTSRLRTNRSHNRVMDEGATSSSIARSDVRCGPRLASTTNARYCANVTSLGAADNDRAAIATSARDAYTTASVNSSGSALPCTQQLLHIAMEMPS